MVTNIINIKSKNNTINFYKNNKIFNNFNLILNNYLKVENEDTININNYFKKDSTIKSNNININKEKSKYNYIEENQYHNLNNNIEKMIENKDIKKNKILNKIEYIKNDSNILFFKKINDKNEHSVNNIISNKKEEMEFKLLLKDLNIILPQSNNNINNKNLFDINEIKNNSNNLNNNIFNNINNKNLLINNENNLNLQFSELNSKKIEILKLNINNILKEINEIIKPKLINNFLNKIDIKLHPEYLGEINLTTKFENNQLEIEFKFTNNKTLELFNNNKEYLIFELKQLITNNNYKLSFINNNFNNLNTNTERFNQNIYSEIFHDYNSSYTKQIINNKRNVIFFNKINKFEKIYFI